MTKSIILDKGSVFTNIMEYKITLACGQSLLGAEGGAIPLEITARCLQIFHIF